MFKQKNIYYIIFIVTIIIATGILIILFNHSGSRKIVFVGNKFNKMLNFASTTGIVEQTKSDFIVTTGIIELPKSNNYGDVSSFKINWLFDSKSHISKQKSFIIQLARDKDFKSIDIDTGIINSADNYYQMELGSLEFGKLYFWRIKVSDEQDRWINWLVGDEPFQRSQLYK